MKLNIEESFPGEFDNLTDIQKAHKVEAAQQEVARAMGLPRGGEMQLIADLAIELGEAYEKRRLKFLEDYAEIALEGAEDE